ncbi:MAG: PTS sugar transporter subunit IIA [Erysipelotrichaceae bacterium]|nr:PTS sugar transporter subunit IIA [Erysipelotrichaceae bacterium]
MISYYDFSLIYNSFVNDGISDLVTKGSEFAQYYLNGNNLIFISNFIKSFEKKNNMKYTDEAFIECLLYICISIKRNKDGFTITDPHTMLYELYESPTINQMISNSIASINKGLDETFSLSELEGILVFFLSKKQFTHEFSSSETTLFEDDYFNRRSALIAKMFIENLEDHLNIYLTSDEDLYNGLLMHIKPAILRLLFNNEITNPLLSDIKEKYPMVFDACKEASEVIENQLHVKINESEISYLALHAEAAIEKVQKKNHLLMCKVIIVCPQGIGTSKVLYYKLLNQFPNIQIERVCSLNDLPSINKENIDFIISTVPLSTYNKHNTICVSPFLDEEDISKIQIALKKKNYVSKNYNNLMVDDIMTIISKYAKIIDHDSLRKTINEYFIQSDNKMNNPDVSLSSYLKENLISLNYNCSSWEQAFIEAGRLLLDSDYINNSYITAMIQNAKQYGAYMIIGDGIALPHAMNTSNVNKTGFSFVTLKDSVPFEDSGRIHQIRFVIGLCVKENNEHFRALSELIEIMSDSNKKHELLNSRYKEEFMNVLKK